MLFADVVHSMQIAATVGAERLREIMAEVAGRCAAVVGQLGGTVDKFTGDGIMAVFGAPTALEDHALRACLAALAIQEQVVPLAVEVGQLDGVELRLRVGLNSGQVIAGEIGSGALGYTAVGEQVGLAQRMESAAAPGGVMLSAATARLVEQAFELGPPEFIRIKGADEPVPARRLHGPAGSRGSAVRNESNLVGRQWEMSALQSLLQRAVAGQGTVVGVVGSPGIGKSRLGREAAAEAGLRGMDVFISFCESHARQIPFHTVSRLLRATSGVEDLDDQAARDRVRSQVPDADPEDLLLFDDLLGIADSAVELPAIDSDARRRRLTAMVNAASLARETPVLYVIEDVHWIDEVSESMLAEFFTVIPQTRAVVLLSYRPEYQGPLSRVPGAQTISLVPLSDEESATLVSQLLGPDRTVAPLADTVAARAAGNPFFAEEIARELTERGVLRGSLGAYVAVTEGAEVTVPATLQATIAARIDRLGAEAKRTLGAASVLGSRFGLDLLIALGIEPVVAELLDGEFIDQVRFTGKPQYAFRHPLIRTVAYEAQLKSDRAEMHRRLAAAIEQQDAVSADEHAALIAEHLESAGELDAAFGWHMRAGAWFVHRDPAAARTSWERASKAADRLPEGSLDRAAKQIAPRTMLCASAWMVGGSLADTGFDELRRLADAHGDKVSLAMAMAGRLSSLIVHARFNDASVLASELVALLDSINDPLLTLSLLYSAIAAKYQVGEFAEVLRLADRMIAIADGDPRKGDLVISSPLAAALVVSSCVRCGYGDSGWKGVMGDAHEMLRDVEAAIVPRLRSMSMVFDRSLTVMNRILQPDQADLLETAELLHLAERFGDEFTLAGARYAHGLNLTQTSGAADEGLALLAAAREAALRERFTLVAAWAIDLIRAQERDQEGALESARVALERVISSGDRVHPPAVTAALVDLLLRRGSDVDLREAQAAVDRLAATTVEQGYVLQETWLLRLRALLARARGDEASYRDYRDRYLAVASSSGYEWHVKLATEMT